jgi:poly-gamma-glutamate synthesis protein (capsule biosynthesis protein)
VLLGGGTHEFKPIELYKGKPIFYSLGNFIFQLRGLLHLPADHHYKYNTHGMSDPDALSVQFDGWQKGLWVQEECFWGIIPYFEFEDGKLTHAEMLPIDLGFRKDTQYKGLPYAATPDVAERIFQSLKTLSATKGTQLRQRDDGIIEIIL